MQAFHFSRSGGFEIEHESFGAMFGNSGADLSVTASSVNRFKVLGKTNRQSLRGSGIILIENYRELFHKSP